MAKFWKMKKIKNANAAELILYGDIASESWWEDDITPKQMASDLEALGDVSEITVRINSDGGDVFAGVAIHSMLKRHKASITVFVDGLAASIASIIAMAGDKIIMPKGAMMMIHNPMSGMWGYADDFRKMADTLDTIRDSMIPIYVEKTGMSKEEITALLGEETWLSAEEAVAQGFATEIEENLKISASVRGKKSVINGVEMDLSKFLNAPSMPKDPEIDDDEDGGPMFDVGDNVQITIPPRVVGQSAGTVREAVLCYAYGILFDGDTEIYHWYTESELKELPEGAESPEPAKSTQNKNQSQPIQGRDLGLEARNLELITLTT